MDSFGDAFSPRFRTTCRAAARLALSASIAIAAIFWLWLASSFIAAEWLDIMGEERGPLRILFWVVGWVAFYVSMATQSETNGGDE